jgi:predicted transcriptional regulator
MKGIFEQMREVEPYVFKKGGLTQKEIKDLAAFFKNAQKEQKELEEKRQKECDANYKHLVKRSKELNKEIPTELIVYLCSPFHEKSFGGWFFEEYKEWIK